VRVLVTGGTGFVGGWLERELRRHGHDAVAVGRADGDLSQPGVAAGLVDSVRPDAIAHLAAVASPRDAAHDPAATLRSTVGGTIAVLEAAAALEPRPPVLVSGSAEIYASRDDTAALTESASLGPRTPYGLAKAGQEGVAVSIAARAGLRLAVTRSFNHTGPGQSTAYVVPALAARLRDVVDGRATTIRVGNLDVRRDISDVRDVVRAYRLLLEHLIASAAPVVRTVNVASGSAVTIRSVVEDLFLIAGREAPLVVDPALVRTDEPRVVGGDARAIEALVGWRPSIPLQTTLADVWAASASGAAAAD
jgi:GDP-4-dehydro-6-deoxy-D-mannose reductase